MTKLPARLKKYDFIEVTGVDWETELEWASEEEVEARRHSPTLMHIPGYFISCEDGVLCWAAMVDVKPRGVALKYIHYMTLAAISGIKIIGRRPFGK